MDMGQHSKQNWLLAPFSRFIGNPDQVAVFFALLFVVVSFIFFGGMLAPLLVAIVIAYLLDVPVQKMTSLGLGRTSASVFVFIIFVAVMIMLLVLLLPLLFDQIAALLSEKPSLLDKLKGQLQYLGQTYPDWVSAERMTEITQSIQAELSNLGQWLLSFSWRSLMGLVALVVYSILVPILVFFMLKDKQTILCYFIDRLPKNRNMLSRVWREIDAQLGNYIRGKVLEIVIVATVTYVTFWLLSVPYTLLLSLLVGVSVLVPYVGAAVVTFPVALIAYFAFGASPQFGYVMLAYGVIQALDGNVLVPVLFSEAVSLHAVAIIAAVLLFGGMWGVWGVFFAIPLAVAVKAIMDAWRQSNSVTIEGAGDT